MELAIWIASIIGILALLGGLSAGSALGLHLLKPNWSRVRRIITAGSFAAMLPMSIAFAGFLFEGDIEDTSEFAIAFVALIATTIMLAILCLPAAWMITRHAEAKDGQAPLLGDSSEDPALIGADG